jgi:hypothetical protein
MLFSWANHPGLTLNYWFPHPFSPLYLEETIVQTKIIATATVFALVSSLAFAPANAASHKHHHHAKMMHRSGMTTGMARTGPAGPSLDGGGVDKSRPGGRGVGRKPSE